MEEMLEAGVPESAADEGVVAPADEETQDTAAPVVPDEPQAPEAEPEPAEPETPEPEAAEPETAEPETAELEPAEPEAAVVPEPPDQEARIAEEAAEPAEEAETKPRRRVAWWPFLTYLGVWAAYSAGALALLFSDPAASPPEATYYGPLLLGGLALTVAGPILTVAVWIVSRRAQPEHLRHGLLATSLLRGAAATLAGVIVWVAALVFLDALRLGWL